MKQYYQHIAPTISSVLLFVLTVGIYVTGSGDATYSFEFFDIIHGILSHASWEHLISNLSVLIIVGILGVVYGRSVLLSTMVCGFIATVGFLYITPHGTIGISGGLYGSLTYVIPFPASIVMWLLSLVEFALNQEQSNIATLAHTIGSTVGLVMNVIAWKFECK